ncbi:hypothetical protein BDW66DRAFT_153716 [Aspergillus desertorum]
MTASYNESRLSEYKFDFVVAVTQGSINATMKTFLSSKPEPELKICYVAEIDPSTSQVVPKEIEFAKLLELTAGVDPFTVDIPSSNPETDRNFQMLLKAKFMAGFKAQMGVPAAADLTKVPDIVGLRGDSAAVDYHLVCSEFTIAALQNEWGSYSWMRKSQDPNHPWLYSATVDLRMGKVEESAYSKLPEAVQKKIKNLSASAFSIQQLLFDLSNAGLSSAARIDGVEPGSILEIILNRFFVSKYVAERRKIGAPMLGCAFVPHETDKSSLTLTDLNFSVNPYSGPPTTDPEIKKDQLNLNCLNYLCAVDKHVLPPPTRFPWNWLQTGDLSDHDGCVSINRNNIRDWLAPSIEQEAKKHCLRPKAYAKHHDGNVTKLYIEIYFGPEETPAVQCKDEGKTVLTLSYDGYSEDSDPAGKIELKYKYTLNLDFVGSNIVIMQNIWVWYYAETLSISNHDVVIDDLRTDTYPITVADGQLVVGEATGKLEHRANPLDRGSVADFFSRINDVVHNIQRQLNNLTSIQLAAIPISAMQGFVFPGGNTFTFKHAEFSKHQDLIAFIKYVS